MMDGKMDEAYCEGFIGAWNAQAGMKDSEAEVALGARETAGWWVCGACGEAFDMVGALACKANDKAGKKPAYCPACGARFTEE
ncbi:MAG: hypothetical protein IJR41_04770 [Atopobiaceae bacterium]|nr:hypothetical protein [Atopobiaceae bacterium]